MSDNRIGIERPLWVLVCFAAAAFLSGIGLLEARWRVSLEMPTHRGAYFIQNACGRCKAAERLVHAYAAEHLDREIVRFDMKRLESIEQRHQYDEAFGAPDIHRFEVPALFVDGDAYIGVDAIRDFVQGKGKAARSPVQRMADRYGPSVLQLLLVATLVAVAVSGASGERRARFALPAVRVFLGCVLIVSTLSKGTHIAEAAQSIAEQWPLVAGAALPLVVALAATEASVGLAFIVGKPAALVARASVMLFGAFLLYALAARMFHVSGDCGCFPWQEPLGWNTVARNTGFLLLSWSLIVTPRSRAISREAAGPCPST